MSDKLKALGTTSTRYVYDKPTASLLETFPNPHTGLGVMSIKIEAPEFTSICPITGQPDFAVIVVTYLPDRRCVESKSFKLYLGSFRNYGDFHEACVSRIATALIHLLDPFELTVEGRFTPRGGIPFWPTITYKKRNQ